MIRVSNWLCGCGQADTCATQAFMTIDLGAAHSLTGVTVWHYYGNERAYCSQKVAISMTGAFQGDPSHCTWGVERRAEFSALGPRAGCFLALGSGLGLVGTASARR